jgi:hypothetical protein
MKIKWLLFIVYMKTVNLILFILITEIPFEKIKLDNTVVFHKLAALSRSLVPHEQPNATTEALDGALYSFRVIVATYLFAALCFSRITIPKVTYCWKEKIVTKSTYEKRLAQQKSVEKRTVVSAMLLCNCFQSWHTSTVMSLQIE